MVATLGAVMFPTWQAVLLILLCFASLGIALYCLLFMVPLKSFVQRIDSLGGGMRGIQSHVDGVRSDVDERIASVDKRLQDQLDQVREHVQGALDSIVQAMRATDECLKKADRFSQKIHTDMRDVSDDARKAGADVHALRQQLSDLHNDLGVLRGELQASTRTMVGESFEKLESTVLGALESVQDEMLRRTSKTLSTRESHAPEHNPPRQRFGNASGMRGAGRSGNKIISAVPLFGAEERDQTPEPAPEAPPSEPAEVTQSHPQETPAK